jgi:glycosyltransferase involved in cell wall biosynthesis
VKVVLLSEVFSKKMGYLGNLLPKYLARLGVEVHLVTMDLPPYHHIKDFKETYAKFSDPQELVPGAVEAYEGFTLHVLAHRNVLGYMRMGGLRKKLSSIRPDIVQTMAAIGWIPLDAAACKPFLGYELFTGCHMTASVFKLANRELPWWNRERLQCALTRAFPGRLASLFTQKCYAATEDCALIASRYFGVQSEKVEVMYLGVDTEHFYPVISETMARDRFELRRQLGFKEDEVVCIYTGKFTDDKKVTMLAEVVERLRANGQSLRAMFIGDGPQRKILEEYSSSVILDFLPFVKLAPYYRAADIGVWPGNESTSMLDAAACGLPIVISDEVHYRAPVEGNGRVFKRDSSQDLERVLLELGQPQTRQRLGSSGAERMARDFSWESLARRRLRDYEEALRVKGPLREGEASRESF